MVTVAVPLVHGERSDMGRPALRLRALLGQDPVSWERRWLDQRNPGYKDHTSGRLERMMSEAAFQYRVSKWNRQRYGQIKRNVKAWADRLIGRQRREANRAYQTRA